MGVATDLSGRQIKFAITTNDDDEVEFEIINGNVDHQADQLFYLPVGRQVKNIITHGHIVAFTFQGVLLVKNYPWSRLTPGTSITGMTVVLNRGGTGGDEWEPDYDEIEHYCSTAQVVRMSHAFDTSTHQVFDITIIADGSYVPPGASLSI